MRPRRYRPRAAQVLRCVGGSALEVGQWRQFGEGRGAGDQRPDQTPATGAAYFAFLLVVPSWQAYMSAQWTLRTPDGLRGRVLATTGLLVALPASLAPLVVGGAFAVRPAWLVCTVLGTVLLAVVGVAATGTVRSLVATGFHAP